MTDQPVGEYPSVPWTIGPNAPWLTTRCTQCQRTLTPTYTPITRMNTNQDGATHTPTSLCDECTHTHAESLRRTQRIMERAHDSIQTLADNGLDSTANTHTQPM